MLKCLGNYKAKLNGAEERVLRIQTLLDVRFILSKQQGSKGLFSKWQLNGWLTFWKKIINQVFLVTLNIGQKQFQMDKIIKYENKTLGKPDEEFNIHWIWGI